MYTYSSGLHVPIDCYHSLLEEKKAADAAVTNVLRRGSGSVMNPSHRHVQPTRYPVASKVLSSTKFLLHTATLIDEFMRA